jgi:hypothetical protein
MTAILPVTLDYLDREPPYSERPVSRTIDADEQDIDLPCPKQTCIINVMQVIESRPAKMRLESHFVKIDEIEKVKGFGFICSRCGLDQALSCLICLCFVIMVILTAKILEVFVHSVPIRIQKDQIKKTRWLMSNAPAMGCLLRAYASSRRYCSYNKA